MATTYPVFSYCEIVNHPHHGRHEPDNLRKLPTWADVVVTYVRRPIALGLVSEADQLLCNGIQLWVSSEGETGKLAVEIPEANRIERGGIHGPGSCVFLNSQQHLVKVYDVCVGSRADLELDSIRVLVPIRPCAARL